MSEKTLAAIEPVWEETLRGGAHWSGVMRRGQALRLTTEGDGANVAALFYSREMPIERYNMADTLKAQHTAHLTTGCVLYSDMGRILCSIIGDTLGWHDPLGGLADQVLVDERYGVTRFQQQRNSRFVGSREAMLVELGKFGLGERDLVANVNFFSKVVVDEDGVMRWRKGHAPTGAAIDLRFEMDTIVLLCNTPHPLDTRGSWQPPDVRLQAWRAPAVGPEDICRRRCPENARGFINTERYCAA
jgi:urea carboxylase-associated protein 2